MELFERGLFAVMMVKTAHKGYPKKSLLALLGYDEKKKLCPKDRRGERFAFTRNFKAGSRTCEVLAAAHNSKKPVLLVSTASNMLAAADYVKTWTTYDTAGNPQLHEIRVPTTKVHALYHANFHHVDVHNHLRQGVCAMADVWDTKQWPHRHFAEGIGFWEVNVFKALTHFHPDFARLQHPEFRCRVAHAMLTLGTAPWGQPANAGAAAGPSASHTYCTLERFKTEGKHESEKHQCGYCKARSYHYCAKCFPDPSQVGYAICSPVGTRAGVGHRPCFAKHLLKEEPARRAQQRPLPRRGERASPYRRPEPAPAPAAAALAAPGAARAARGERGCVASVRRPEGASDDREGGPHAE